MFYTRSFWHNGFVLCDKARLSTIFRAEVSSAGFNFHGCRQSWILCYFRGTSPFLDVKIMFCFKSSVFYSSRVKNTDFELSTNKFTSVSLKGCIPKVSHPKPSITAKPREILNFGLWISWLKFTLRVFKNRGNAREHFKINSSTLTWKLYGRR